MTYTVWLHGQQIGQTNFELHPGRRQHAGAFHPTEFGLQVLPSITAMAPALLDFGALCRSEGFDTDSPDPALGAEALDTFAETTEARRVMDAAKHIAALEVRDPSGQLVKWQTLLITDVKWLVSMAREQLPANEDIPMLVRSDPIRYLISLTEKIIAAPAARTVQ